MTLPDAAPLPNTLEQEYAVLLNHFAAEVRLAPELHHLLGSQGIEPFLLGAPSNHSTINNFTKLRCRTLGSIVTDLREIQGKGFVPRGSEGTDDPAIRRQILAQLEQKWSDGSILTAPDLRMWRTRIKPSTDAELANNALLLTMFVGLQVRCIATAPDIQPRPLPTPSHDVAPLLNLLQLESILSEVNPINTPEELTACLDSFMAHTQIELTGQFISEIWELGMVGNGGQTAARRLYNKYRGQLFQHDFEAKRRMIQELSEQFVALASRYTHPAISKLLLDMGSRTQTMVTGVDKTLAFFRDIYVSRGYEMPEALRPPAEIVHDIGTAATTDTVDAQLASAEPLPKVESAEITTLSQQIAAFARPWSLTSAGKKAHRDLILQLRLERGEGDWEHVVATADRLRGLLGAGALASHPSPEILERTALALAQDIAAQRALASQARDLRLRALQSHTATDLPEVPAIGRALELLARDHDLCQRIIERTTLTQTEQTHLLANIHVLLTAWEWLPRP